MKILWITNITFPEALCLLKGKGNLKGTGGWLIGSAKQLSHQPGVKLIVASISPEVNSLTRIEGDQIVYYLLPYGKGNKKLNSEYDTYWKEIKQTEQPSVIHLHGTEYTHGLSYINACGSDGVCVSLQGVIGVIAKYSLGGLTYGQILASTTISSFFSKGLFSDQRAMIKQALVEEQILCRVNHISGRTTFDRDYLWSINPKATYYHCNETLRDTFYNAPRWDYYMCAPQTIFLSQAASAIKGLHIVLQALPIVLKHYPDTKVRIAGLNITSCDTLSKRLKIKDYGLFIRRLIKKNNLQECVVFLGQLDENEIKKEYLNANLFICPSIIENSPNSLAEAQILGVPCLASYAGGIPDMMRGDEEHLYRFDDHYALAHRIVNVFEKEENIDTDKMREIALRRHDPQKNLVSLMGMYESILNCNKE